jgi:type IV secretory pathway VirB4 component
MLDLREHKRVHDTLSDVLPWAALVAPDVVLNKDGSFLSVIRYRGPDLDSSTENERVVKAAHINNILRRLGSGWAQAVLTLTVFKVQASDNFKILCAFKYLRYFHHP